MPNLSTAKLTLFNFILQFSSFLGIFLSLYSLYVEINFEHDKDYKAMCDINEKMSCTKAFGSEYGRGFGIVRLILGNDSILNQPNSIFGVIGYLTTLLLARSNSVGLTKILLQLSVVFNFMSLYLATILMLILHDFCVVCVSTYVVNAALLFGSYLKYKHLTRTSSSNVQPSNGKKSQ